MDSKITCSNCGWSWKASESSKADLYNCHNCGANNAPAKQEEVEKAQNGKKLIPKEEETGWLDKIDNVLSAPARATTYAVEAGLHAVGARKAPPKYENPSAGIGIDEKEHPYLAMATDMILDPTNLIGAGAVSKLGKLAKGVKTVEKTRTVLQPAVKAALKNAEIASKLSGELTKYSGWTRKARKSGEGYKEYYRLLDELYKPEIVQRALKLGAKDGIGAVAIINDLIRQHPEQKEDILKQYKTTPTKSNTSSKVSDLKNNKSTQRKTGVATDQAAEYSSFIKPISAPVRKPNPKVQALPTLLDSEGIDMSGNELESDINIRNRARVPKSFKVEEDINMNFGGTNTKYNVPFDQDRPMPDLGPGNTRKITPQYQMGGEIPQAQNGKQVKYNTPEYREEYNKGNVLSSTGERSPIALDEVTVQNDYKRPRNWLEQYADKIVDENKDAGLMGSIFGTPISAVTSIPQMFATKAMTGEMQRPSEAMNIQNPYGAMAVDAVLDPANLAGAGLLTKENLFSGLGKIRTGINPELMQGLQSQGVGNIIEDVKSFTNKKFIPGKKIRTLPETLVPNIEYSPNSSTHTKIHLKDSKGSSFGYLGLENKNNWIRDEIGQFTYDDKGFPIKGEPEWVSPSMISVSDKLQGNQTQDLLYQLGIEEAKKRGMKGVYSGETLLSPEKTKKAHERFNREIFGQKVARATDEREAINHDIVGLTGHTNPNVIEDWMEKYKNINKFSRKNYSINDIASAPFNYIKENPKDALPLGVVAAGIGGLGWATNELINLDENRVKKFNKEQEEYNKKNKKKEYGGEIPQAQNGMNPERAYRQPDWNEEEPLELVNNFNQEVIDSGQTFVHPLLRKAPGIGSALGIAQSYYNGEEANASDTMGLIPHPYAQAASLGLLQIENKKKRMGEVRASRETGKPLTQLLKEKAFVDNDGNVRIDNTATTKPKIGSIRSESKAKSKSKSKSTLKDYNPSYEINRKVIDKTSTVKPKLRKNGGVVKDDRGQWDHPGEITEISGDTMATHGYGDIPLYVVPDVGEPRMVQANSGTQKFPGAKKFTEYPMAQNGKKISGGLGVEDWWNNREEIQSTYKMANDVDPFVKNWMNNPVTKGRLNSQIGYLMEGKNPVNVINKSLDTLPVYDQRKMSGKSTSDFVNNYRLQNNIESDEGYYEMESTFNRLRGEPNVAGKYIPKIHSMSMRDNGDKGTLAHEMTHGSGIQDKMENYMEINYNQKADPNYTKDSYGEEYYNYLKKDGMYPRIMNIRSEFKLKPGQKVDSSLFNKVNEGARQSIGDLREMYEDDEIINILNTVAEQSSNSKQSVTQARNGKKLTNFAKPEKGWLDKY